ncbi:FAD linked oxidase, C-terminal domain protein [Sulfitobacter noctilucae]|uniref:FAD-binding oxidoreductase n=1 Tax=Sulfitobacter noctilucae TaxID=1342302 RepID=UPI00046A395B|nr:FAD-binding oxidoreductase [Sulfitobacter noctilucae]KIN61790.1 FAD linked oxidase, C-terminal domain protein [Sulfitobacter noctilucae]
MTLQQAAADFASLSDTLCSIVGAAHVLTQASDVAGYLEDWTGQYSAPALAVVRPGSTAQVAEVVKLCAAEGIAVVPQGGRTGLCGGGVPLVGQSSIVLSLTRMNAVRTLDPAGRTVTAEAGVVLEKLQAAALEHQLIFPLMFGAKGSCTIGGNLSTNAGGSNVVRYGTTRELCVGIEAVMPDGSVINALTGLRKDNTGYDLKDLLIGAEGTLGIITAAVFKLFPEPRARSTAFLSVPSLDTAIQVLNRLQDHTGGAVVAFEYMPKAAIDVICQVFPETRRPLDEDAPTGILVEVASSRPRDGEPLEDGSIRLEGEVMALLGELMEEGLVLDAMLAQSEQQRGNLWQMRERILESITDNGPAYHLDISLPLAHIAPFVEAMDPVMAALGFQPLTVGHLGDGNLHYALSAAAGETWGDLPLEAAKDQVFAKLTELNGSFSAEHGIGQSKLPVMRDLKEPAQLAIMRRIKAALDPLDIMNPGKLIPDVKKNLREDIE